MDIITEDSSAPNPQQTSVQLADVRSLPLTEVIKSLKNEEDADIFAWLKLARSLRVESECSSDLPRLTLAQIRAIAVLRYCNTDEISAMLRRVRTSSTSNQASTTGQRLTLAAGAMQTSGALASHGIHDEASQQQLEGSFIPSDAHQQIPIQGPPAQPLPQECKYYCTYCDPPREFGHPRWWKMHERSHLSNNYICMPNGATEHTQQGIKCAFCEQLNPSEDHLSGHNAQICGSGLSAPFVCQDRFDFVNHLYLTHHLDDWKPILQLVPKWKDTVCRQAWSCGFCVIALARFEDRLSHIALHFQQGQTMDTWDTTNVIQGLLQQPGVIRTWYETLVSVRQEKKDCLYWEKDGILALRRDLEIGPTPGKTARDLAEAAFAASKVDFRKWAEKMEVIDPDYLTNPNIFDFA